jgi:hypothetical protein
MKLLAYLKKQFYWAIDNIFAVEIAIKEAEYNRYVEPTIQPEVVETEIVIIETKKEPEIAVKPKRVRKKKNK